MIEKLSLYQTQNRRQWALFFGFAALALIAVYALPELFAQEDGEEGSTKGALTMWDNMKQGGLFMLPLALLSMAMVTLIIYNLIQLTKPKFSPPELHAALHDHMANCRVRSAIEVSSTSPTYLGRIMAHALPHVDATQPEDLGREAVEDSMAEFTIRENRGYMTWIGYLSVIAQGAPMLGLLGTVVGMMGAFNKMGATGGAKPEELAGDIGLAMITTACGLVIAIPAVFGYFFLRNKLNRLVAESHAAAGEMLDASINAVNAEQLMAKVPEGLA